MTPPRSQVRAVFLCAAEDYVVTTDQPSEKHPHHSFKDILGRLRLEGPAEQGESPSTQLDGNRLAELLEKNFDRLDPNHNGITREEIAQALLARHSFSEEEYAMLQLLGYYFEMIANMADDEKGPQTVITRMDKDVLNQFLRYGNLNLDELYKWRAAGVEKQHEDEQ